MTPDPQELLDSAPRISFSGTVHRICAARFSGQILSVRGSLLHEGRYNIAGEFGILYTSIDAATAEREIARYFTVPPKEGFARASVNVSFTRVVDLTNNTPAEVTGRDHAYCQAVGRLAWETGIEALLVPSAVLPGAGNLAIVIDNQSPGWMLGLQNLTLS